MNITGSAMVFYDNAYYMFGGDVDYEYSSTIARFDELTRNWSKVGDLEVALCCSSVIYNGEFFMVIGGDAEFSTERCSIQNSTISCTTQEPYLNTYAWSALFLVEEMFCMK